MPLTSSRKRHLTCDRRLVPVNVKVRVDIEVDRKALGAHGGARYKLNKFIFDGRTGATLGHVIGCDSCMTLKEARARKREILEDYRG